MSDDKLPPGAEADDQPWQTSEAIEFLERLLDLSRDGAELTLSYRVGALGYCLHKLAVGPDRARLVQVVDRLLDIDKAHARELDFHEGLLRAGRVLDSEGSDPRAIDEAIMSVAPRIDRGGEPAPPDTMRRYEQIVRAALALQRLYRPAIEGGDLAAQTEILRAAGLPSSKDLERRYARLAAAIQQLRAATPDLHALLCDDARLLDTAQWWTFLDEFCEHTATDRDPDDIQRALIKATASGKAPARTTAKLCYELDLFGEEFGQQGERTRYSHMTEADAVNELENRIGKALRKYPLS